MSRARAGARLCCGHFSRTWLRACSTEVSDSHRARVDFFLYWGVATSYSSKWWGFAGPHFWWTLMQSSVSALLNQCKRLISKPMVDGLDTPQVKAQSSDSVWRYRRVETQQMFSCRWKPLKYHYTWQESMWDAENQCLFWIKVLVRHYEQKWMQQSSKLNLREENQETELACFYILFADVIIP